MSNRTNRIFQVGDRVAERPKTHGMVAVRAAAREQVAQVSQPTVRYSG